MPVFNVTYEIWDEDAVEAGDTDERGFIIQGASLREALDAVKETRTSQVSGIECIEPSDSNVERARWFTVNNGPEFRTGARETRSLHIPDSVSESSRRRIARLIGIDVPIPDPSPTSFRI